MSSSSTELFGTQASEYGKFRPTYPVELFDLLLEKTAGRQLCVDVGCGTGQATTVLALSFDKVVGMDSTQKQLDAADKAENIEYVCASAEEVAAHVEPGTVDLLVCAQAAHWLDWEAFCGAAQEVVKEDGVVAVWGYGNVRTINGTQTDLAFDKWYWDELGYEYWDSRRHHIDSRYRLLQLPWEGKENHSLSIQKELSTDEFLGYLGTMSAVNTWRKRNSGEATDILDAFRTQLEAAMAADGITSLKVQWPVFLQVAKMSKHMKRV